MKFNKLLLLAIPLLLTGCFSGGGSFVPPSQQSQSQTPSIIPSSKGDSSVVPGSSSKPESSIGSSSSVISSNSSIGPSSSLPSSSISSSVDPTERSEYDYACDVLGEPGHLYFHYYRGDEEQTDETYQKYCLWLWEKKPKDDDGIIFAGSDAKVQQRFNTQTQDWEPDIFESGKKYDEAGGMIDIDLNDGITYPRAEKTKQEVKGDTKLSNATKLGFLIVEQSSMDGTQMFVSDGGSDTWVDMKSAEVRPNGSYHLFVRGGDVKNFKWHHYTSGGSVNPVTKDQTGKYRSTNTDALVNKTKSQFDAEYPVSSSSSTFKSNAGVGYFIFVASFADSDGDGMGDIRGIINNLDYFQYMNVDTLWLSPVQESDSYHGYDTVNYMNIDSKFGTMEDYEELLEKAHNKGMKVMMDLVLNHTSKNNQWFLNSQKASEEDGIKYRDLYQWKFKGDKVQVVTAVTTNPSTGQKDATYKTVTLGEETNEDYDKYGLAWYKDGLSDYYYFGKFGSSMPELNYDNQATRDLVVNVAKEWAKKGVDGFRLDAVKHIYMTDEVKYTNTSTKDSHYWTKDVGEKTYYSTEQQKKITTYFDYSCDTTKNLHFWRFFNSQLKSAYPNCYLLGENFDGWDARIAGFEQGMDSQFDFASLYHNQEFLTKGTIDGVSKKISDLASELETRYGYYKQTSDISAGGSVFYGGKRVDAINSTFTSNHDTARQANMLNGGNNVTSSSASAVYNKVRIDAAIKILTTGLSWMYYGDELGMTSNYDASASENLTNTDRWSRQPYKWGSTKASQITNYTFGGMEVKMDDFNKDTLPDQEQQIADANSLLNYYRALCAAKKEMIGCNWSTFKANVWDNNANIYSFSVNNGTNTFWVHINNSSSNVSFGVGKGTLVGHDNKSTTSTIAPYGFVVVKE